jgi:hypothetical protein
MGMTHYTQDISNFDIKFLETRRWSQFNNTFQTVTMEKKEETKRKKKGGKSFS